MGARSQACLTCKTRRVKCDEAHPNCHRCLKAGIRCTGYEPHLKFIDERPRLQRTQRVAQRQQQEILFLKTGSQLLYHSNGLRHVVDHPKSTCLTKELVPTACNEDIVVSFLVAKLFQGRKDGYSKHKEGLGIVQSSSNWISELSNKHDRSIIALATIFFGHAHDLRNMVVCALGIYSKALTDLRADLLSPASASSFGTTASITALCMFELAACRSGTAWMTHAAALAHVMESRDPRHYQAPPEKSLFLEQRVILIWHAMLSAQKTFLSQDQWKIVPWQNGVTCKEPFDFLLDILCDIAELLADLKAWAKSRDSIGRPHLRRSINSSLLALNDWWRSWAKSNSNACQEVVTDPESSITVDSIGHIYRTVLVYDKLWTAYTICTYNTARILLLQAWKAVAKVETLVIETNTTPLLGIGSCPVTLAHEILRSIQFCNEQSESYMGTFCAVFILDVAYSALNKGSREARWLWGNDGETQPLNVCRDEQSSMRVIPSCQVGQCKSAALKSLGS